jgi:hypothetical protein
MPVYETRTISKVASSSTISAPRPKAFFISQIISTVGIGIPYEDGPIPIEYRELHGLAIMRSAIVYLAHSTRPGPAS